MKIVLFIHVAFTLICILLIFLASACAKAKYKRKYPNFDLPKRTFVECLTGRIRTIIFSLIPILNILWFFVFVFKWDYLIDETVQKLKEQKEEEES